jgi:hypothetical protein
VGSTDSLSVAQRGEDRCDPWRRRDPYLSRHERLQLFSLTFSLRPKLVSCIPCGDFETRVIRGAVLLDIFRLHHVEWSFRSIQKHLKMLTALLNTTLRSSQPDTTANTMSFITRRHCICCSRPRSGATDVIISMLACDSFPFLSSTLHSMLLTLDRHSSRE